MVRAMHLTPIDAPETALVKLLDLLTNRYHVGLVRAAATTGAEGDQTVYLELPASARLSPGQRVRFIVADGRALIQKRTMRRACITHILPEGPAHIHVRLQALPDSSLN